MKILPIEKLTGRDDDEVWLLLTRKQLHDLLACTDIASRVLAYCDEHPHFLRSTTVFRGCMSTFDHKGTHETLKAEFERAMVKR